MKKLLCLAAATLMLGGLATLPTAAMAAGTAPPPPAKHTMHKASAKHHMHHRMAHKRSCYDYAWQSQQMKDCQAGATSKPMAKTSAKKHMKKHMTMKKS